MENQTQTPFQAAFKPGIVMGLISMAITYITYFIDSSLLASVWFGLGSLVVFISLIIYFGSQYRSELGGFMSFGAAFNFSFIAILVSGFLSFIGQILLFQLIDPSLPEVLAEITFENSLKMMESFGQNPDSMPTEALDALREQSEGVYSLGGQIKNFGMSLIGFAIIALILAAILKKRDKSLDY
jgi:hypothetical protein